MPTLNISLAEPLRDYIEARATEGSYSTSEYVRQLIRDDQRRHDESQRDRLWELLAIGVKQLDDGDFADTTADDVKARGRVRHAARSN
jgi:antitoxin ParD1/3/4